MADPTFCSSTAAPVCRRTTQTSTPRRSAIVVKTQNHCFLDLPGCSSSSQRAIAASAFLFTPLQLIALYLRLERMRSYRAPLVARRRCCADLKLLASLIDHECPSWEGMRQQQLQFQQTNVGSHLTGLFVVAYCEMAD